MNGLAQLEKKAFIAKAFKGAVKAWNKGGKKKLGFLGQTGKAVGSIGKSIGKNPLGAATAGLATVGGATIASRTLGGGNN